jgi:hypothetical protein
LCEKSVDDISDIPYETETIFPEDQLDISFTLGLPYLRAQKTTRNSVMKLAEFRITTTLWTENLFNI